MRADDHIHTAAQDALLRPVLRAAVQHHRGQAEGLGVVLKVGGHLGRGRGEQAG
jgi:hypothetical protein